MCTGIKLTAKNGAIIYARTLEFGQDLASNIVMIPRNYTCNGTVPLNNNGLPWQTTYAAVGANACNINTIVDGVNEKGLAGGLFYFTDYADFQPVQQSEMQHALAPWNLMTWILTTCATVAQVKQVLPTIKVANVVFGPWNIVPPVHAIVHDAQGQSVVIEYVNGQLNMHDNPLGTITNAPTFDWHMINLKNYINLSAFNINKKQLGNVMLATDSQGSGMLGLPGDFTSPSRFVRATAVSQAVVQPQTEEDARDMAFHILNLFDIPMGVVREVANNQVHYDHTEWTSACDINNKRYYFHTYDDRQIRMVDLMKMNLDVAQPVVISMQGSQKIVDVTMAK